MAYDALNADQRAGATLNGKPSFTVEQAAIQLTREGRSWSDTLGQGAIVTYAFRDVAPTTMPNGSGGFTPFDAGQILMAERALAAWATVADIRFVRVGGSGYSSDATILFGNFSTGADEAAAFAYLPGNAAPWSVAGDIWIDGSYAPNREPAGFNTLLHEIGHAIGLTHPSDYDSEDDPSYAASAAYAQDSLEYTVMSYFDGSATGASPAPYPGAVATPLMDDIAAVQRLYGPNRNAHAGATTYGTGTVVFAGMPPFATEEVALPRWGTVWDAGGIDTIVLPTSGAGGQLLDLRPGSFSRYDGSFGLLSIAVGAVIENGKSGERGTTFIGNGADNIFWGVDASSYTGNGGDDAFLSYSYQWAESTVTDFGIGDRIVVLDGRPDSLAASLSGDLLTFSGGSVRLGNAPTGSLVIEAYGDAAAIRLTAAAALPAGGAKADDFNGDGRSDILWRNLDGTLSDWLGTPAGGFTANDAAALTRVGSEWRIAETGDFNGDGRADILWRHADGALSDWLGTASGGFAANDAAAFTRVGTDWRVAGAGDFNGDGRDDILWRHADGALSDWLGTASGGFAANDAAAFTRVGTEWQVAGTGDYDGDGRDDILWRNTDGSLSDWLGTVSGGFAGNDANALVRVGIDWFVA